MKDDQTPVHQLAHAEQTFIHDPDEDMTALARWLRRAMEQGPQFWLLVGGGVVALLGLSALVSGLAASKSAGSQAWAELTQAKTVEERLKIAEAHPKTPVAGWARLYSAQEEYAYGVDDLTTPGKKELAGPRLKKALELFQQVANDAAKDSSQALGGLFGAARTLEARNELPEAIAQYKVVAERFPKAPEAKIALAMIKALEEPLNQAFYKELYAYKPPATASIPGVDLGGLGIPGSLLSPPSNLGLGQPAKSFIPENMTPPPGLDAPPPSTTPTPPTTTTPALEPPKVEASKKDEIPPPVDTPKPAETKAEPAPETAKPPK